jgi:hypothetical protein
MLQKVLFTVKNRVGPCCLLFETGPLVVTEYYLFYNFETTQNKMRTSIEHVPNLVRSAVLRYVRRRRQYEGRLSEVAKESSFWTNPVGDLISYVFKSRPWADKARIEAILN